jgi:hypothetical protein
VQITLTIDDDLAVLIEQESRRSGESFNATVNHLLRLGLSAARQQQNSEPSVVTPNS